MTTDDPIDLTINLHQSIQPIGTIYIFAEKGKKKGLSFISNRQRRKEGTFCASELAGIEPTPTHSRRAGYARLNLSATGGMLRQSLFLDIFINVRLSAGPAQN